MRALKPKTPETDMRPNKLHTSADIFKLG